MRWVALFLLVISYPTRASAQDKRLAPVGTSGRKMALVIGNYSYSSGVLKNPKNDALDMRAALASKGFNVWPCCDNASAQQLEETIDRWTSSLLHNDIAFFYYSGHGLRLNGYDYLLPTDYKASYTQADVPYKTYVLDRLQDKMAERGTKLNIIVVDACRNNPFTTSKSLDKGLAPLTAGTGTIIFFAAAEGRTADDNDAGENSLFTQVLLEKLQAPTVSVRTLQFTIKDEVYKLSNNSQLPYISDGMVFDYTFGVSSAPSSSSQPASTGAGAISGRVLNAAGQPITKGFVRITGDLDVDYNQARFVGTGDIDSSGRYAIATLPPGEYFGYVVLDDKNVDRMRFTLQAGDQQTIDFDMTRAEYINTMTADERRAVEEYKQRTATSVQANHVIASLNATLTSVREDLKQVAPNFDDDLSKMTSAIEQRPQEALLWTERGDIQIAKAKHLSSVDQANKVNAATDTGVRRAYADAITSYEQAIQLVHAQQPAHPEQEAVMQNQLGTAYAGVTRFADAASAFERAADLQPVSAAMYYGNEAAVLFNAHQEAAALAAAEKAISADPSKPMPYYIKGQTLISRATVDNKGKIITPTGCVEAYNKYLELDPTGSQAAAVREILQSIPH